MSHLASGPGRGNPSQHDSGTRFKQLVHDYIACCPELAREYLQIEGIQATPETVTRIANQFLPQYIDQVARFLQTATPPVPQVARDEAFNSALTHLLVNEQLGLAAKVLESPNLPISRAVREQIRPLAEYAIISAIQSEKLSEIIALGSALDPMFFHRDDYCDALTRAIHSYIEAGEIAKIVSLVDTPVQIPDKVIFRTRSEVEDAIIQHVSERRPLAEPYALSEMFLLSDFFKSPRFLDVVQTNIAESLEQRKLSTACRLADECENFKLIRRSLEPAATTAVKAAVAKFRFYAEEERTRENTAVLETLSNEIQRTVETFALSKNFLKNLPTPLAERRVLRVGYPVCKLVHPPRQRREE